VDPLPKACCVSFLSANNILLPLYLVINNDQCLQAGSVQLGFLPREVAKWVAPLSDSGFFNFSGFIYPREALEAAFGVNNTKVQLLLYVSKVHQKVSKRPFLKFVILL
jgi:hypothetical protein